MMKILITGAGGQLGRSLMRSLAAHQLTALDHTALDITRLNDVRSAVAHYRPGLLINASAFNEVDAAEAKVQEAYSVNAVGPRNLAIATGSAGIPLLHVSTDYVFNGTAKRPYHEYDRTDPLSVYGASKLAGEDAVRTLNTRHFIVRTAWLFSEHRRSFLSDMRARAVSAPPRVADDQFGSPTYAPHLALSIGQLITSEAYGVYHLAGNGGTSRWEFVCEFFRRLGVTTLPVPVSQRTFASAAVRPSFSVLMSIQDPRIELPAWQEGVAEFARRIG
jgi:dTDP-4-dehydrorhamnose reductase